MPNEILHDAHKEHPLLFSATGKIFFCDGCNYLGVGSRYRCHDCDFNLHEVCPTRPQTVSKEIHHDAHKMHPLVLRRRTGSSAFRCKGCGCPGAGSRYRCDACDFDMHELCATCPPTASLAFHGHHPMTFERAVYSDENPRRCDLCDTSIDGMHYSCRPCDFNVHPVCCQLPAAAVSPLHPEHLVMLTSAKPVECTRCGTQCFWRYRCAPCKVNLHPRCLLGSDKTPLGIPKDNCQQPLGLFWS